jgi:hypothetical protein
VIGTLCVASNSDSNGAPIAETPLDRQGTMTESTAGAYMDHLEDWLITIICTALTIGIAVGSARSLAEIDPPIHSSG